MGHFLSLLLFISTFCQAQETDVRWSQEEKYLKTSPSPLFLGEYDTKLYFLKATEYSPLSYYYVDVIDKKSLAVSQKITFNSTLFPKIHTQELIQLFFDGEHFYVFSGTDKDNVQRIYGSIFDKNGKLELEGKLLKEVNSNQKQYAGYSDIYTTEGSKGFLIFTDSPTNKIENEKVEYKVLDAKLEVVAEKQITLPYSEKNFILQYPFMDPKGNVYLLGTKKDESEPDKTTDVIFYYSLKTDLFNEIQLPATSIYNSGVYINFDERNHIEVTGLYGNKPTFKRYREGIYYTKMEVETGKVLESRTTPFDAASVQGVGKRWVREGTLLSKDYLIKNLLTLDNGDKVYMLELTRDGVSAYSGDAGFERGHLLMVKVDKEGKLLWGTTIPKVHFLHVKQYKINGLMGGPVNTTVKNYKYTSLLSFIPIKDKSAIHILYTDRMDNLKIENPDELEKTDLQWRGCVSFLATIDPNGKMQRKVFMQTKLSQYWIMSENSTQLEDGSTLLLACDQENRLFKIGILTIKH